MLFRETHNTVTIEFTNSDSEENIELVKKKFIAIKNRLMDKKELKKERLEKEEKLDPREALMIIRDIIKMFKIK